MNDTQTEPFRVGDWVEVTIGMTYWTGWVGRITAIMRDNSYMVMFPNYDELPFEAWEISKN